MGALSNPSTFKVGRGSFAGLESSSRVASLLSPAAVRTRTMAEQVRRKRLSVKKPEDLVGIQARRDSVLNRYQQFKNAAQQRRAKLEQAKQLQQFRRDADELEAWIKEKVQIASDEAYKDRRNLQVGSCRTQTRALA